jgi:hypothetical protein
MADVIEEYPPDRVGFTCPGCGWHHALRIRGDRSGGRPLWEWNGDRVRPTFSPSILVRTHTHEPPVTPANLEEWKRAPWPQRRVDMVCHSFVRDGQIEFLSDCTHPLAGQTVPLPEIREDDDEPDE